MITSSDFINFLYSIDSHIVRGYMLDLDSKEWRADMDAISINNLSKVYKGNTTALENLTLNIPQNQIFSILGTNGAGKTTLINILTTYLHQTSGTISILGIDITKDTKEIRKQIACVSQKLSIDTHLSLIENMLFQGRLYGLDKKSIKTRTEKLITAFGLSEYVDKKVSTYSDGIKRRLDIAMSMISFPKILFLDEPTVGMDIQSRISLWNMLRTIKQDYGTTIILTTHYLEEADKLSDTICFIKNGTVVLQDTPSNLKKFTQLNMIRICFYAENSAMRITEITKGCKFSIKEIYCDNCTVDLFMENCSKHFSEITQKLLDLQISFKSIEVLEPTLDSIFMQIMNEQKGRA